MAANSNENDVSPLRHPLVLVHGLRGPEGFNFSDHRGYFRGLEDLLSPLAPRLIVPILPPMSSVATRAAELKAFIQREVGSQPVHILGHSMGGLDARYAISRLDLPARSLISIGTPHRGSSFADWGVDRFARFVRPLFRSIGWSDEAFHDLRRDDCARFNEAVPDHPEVKYASVAGQCEWPFLGPEWWLPARIVREQEGANDGIVSVASAKWGHLNDVWSGDHLNLVNWPNRRGLEQDRRRDYLSLVKQMKNWESV